jgi:hypothetical protein
MVHSASAAKLQPAPAAGFLSDKAARGARRVQEHYRNRRRRRPVELATLRASHGKKGRAQEALRPGTLGLSAWRARFCGALCAPCGAYDNETTTLYLYSSCI